MEMLQKSAEVVMGRHEFEEAEHNTGGGLGNELNDLAEMDHSFNGGDMSNHSLSRSDIKEYRRGTLNMELN